MGFRNVLILVVGLAISATCAFAKNEKIVEGQKMRDGICIDYKKLYYDVDQGGGNFVTKMKVLEKECGTECYDIVYDGPEGGYTGDISTLPGAGLPFTIDAGGHGYVTVPSGYGGMLAPDSPSCDATYTPDYSTTFIIHAQLLSGIYIE